MEKLQCLSGVACPRVEILHLHCAIVRMSLMKGIDPLPSKFKMGPEQGGFN
jgi:hypothetical protein